MWVRDDGNIELLLDLYAQFRKPKRKRIILSIGILMKRVSLDPCGSKSGGLSPAGTLLPVKFYESRHFQAC